MSTHSLRKKLLRYKQQPTGKRRLLRTFRKYAPWVAAVCVGAYLPPKVFSAASNWAVDKSGFWNDSLNWSNGVPNATGAEADFIRKYTGDLLVSTGSGVNSAGTTVAAIQPIVQTIKFDDQSPSSTLTINTASAPLKLSGAPLIDVTKGNSIVITGATASVLTYESSPNVGLQKTGAGLLNIQGTGNFTGQVKLTQGILIASTLANGDQPSSIGASPSAATNLVFNGGTLRYVSALPATINRSFQIGLGGATIGSSSTLAANFLSFNGTVTNGLTTGTNTITFSEVGKHVLTLRGTNMGANEIAATITDSGPGVANSTSLVKLDVGLWRLSALVNAAGVAYQSLTTATPSIKDYTGNTFTGDVIVQRGTLQLVFPPLPTVPVGQPAFKYTDQLHVGVIAQSGTTVNTLQLGAVPGSGLPGGGTLDLQGGVVQTNPVVPSGETKPFLYYQGAIQDFKQIIVNSGANAISRSTGLVAGSNNSSFVYIDNFNTVQHNQGGTLKISNDAIVRTANANQAKVGSIVNGWTYINDSWITTVVNDVSTAYSSNFKSMLALSTYGGYKFANNADNGPGLFGDADNVSVGQPITDPVDKGTSGVTANQFKINSLRFTQDSGVTLPAQLQIANGVPQADGSDDRTLLSLASGGLMFASAAGFAQLNGGGLTSGSGNFTRTVDPTNVNNHIDTVTGGGSLGHSELFLIANATATNMYISSKITNFTSSENFRVLTVGLTKSGPGNVILFDQTSTGTGGVAASDYQGSNYINAGGIIVRANHALGATVDDSNTYHFDDFDAPPSELETVGKLGQTFLLGETAFLDFQGVNYTAAEPINFSQGEIRASSGRSNFYGRIKNLNSEVKVPINVGTYLEIYGDLINSATDTDPNAPATTETGGGYQKTGAGILVVHGNTNIKTVSEIPDAGNLDLVSGISSWLGNITIENGSLKVFAGQHAIGGDLTITNGIISNASTIPAAGAFLAFTKAGGQYTADLEQSGNNAVTLFGNVNQAVTDVQKFSGLISLKLVTGATNAGSIVIDGSINFAALTPAAINVLDLTNGFLTQIATVNPAGVPTTTFSRNVIFAQNNSTILLNHNTIFNNPVTIGAAGAAVNVTASGIGATTFAGAVSLVNGNLTLANTSFSNPLTVGSGALVLNGLDSFNTTATGTVFTMNGGTLTEAGTRRSAGVYGIRNTFNGDVVLSSVNGAASPSTPANLVPNFSANDSITGGLLFSGSAPLTGVDNTKPLAKVILTATLANALLFPGTLTIDGGQVTVANSNALGTGSISAGNANGTGGVFLKGEKSVLLFQRGVETAANEDITIGPATAYISGVAITNYGTGYTAAPTVTVGGGGATLDATLVVGGVSIAPTSTNNGVSAVALNYVGQGYNSAANFTVSAPASGTTATLAAVFGGAIIRGVDQHNVIDGNIILNNVNTSSATGTIGAVSLGTPMISVGQDDSLQIKGAIFGAGTVNSGTARSLTTALLGGGTNNSSSGILILSGEVRDTQTGFAPTVSGVVSANALNFEIAGNNDLNVQLDQPYKANGLLQLAQGILRDTNAASTNFFATGTNFVPNFSLSVANTAVGRQSVGFNSITSGIQTAALFLTQPGQTFNAGFTAYLGNSNKVSNDGSSTGFIVIGGENKGGTTTSFGTGASTITLAPDSNAAAASLRDLRLFANSGGIVEIKSNFAKTGTGLVSIDKVGDGTVIIDGLATSNVLDRAYVLGGTLELGAFSANQTSQRLGSAQVILGGGTLRLNTTGATGTTALSQTTNSTATVRNGLSVIQVVNPNVGQTVNFRVGNTTTARAVGGVVKFNSNPAATGTTGISNILFSGLGASVPIGWASYGTSTAATDINRANFFAANDSTGANIIGKYTGATTVTDVQSAATNMQEDGSTGFFLTPTKDFSLTTLNTARFTGAASSGKGILDLGTKAVTVTGGIMLASDATGPRSIINGIGLSGSGASDLVIQNWGGTVSQLTIGAKITNSSTNLNALTIAGDGVTLLTNTANDFKGDVYLSGGTLQVSGATLGADSGSPAVQIKSLQLDGGTFSVVTNDFNWASRNIIAYGDRSTISVATGRTFTLTGGAVTGQTAPTLAFSGGINSQSPEVGLAANGSGINYGSAGAGVANAASGAANIFNGDLTFSGGGTFLQVRDGAANTIAGQINVATTTKFVYEGNNYGFLGNNLSWMDGTTIQSGGTIEIRPTVNSAGTNNVAEFLHFSGLGQAGSGGAIVMKRPEAIVSGVTVNAATAITDHLLSWTGPVIMDGNASIFVDDKPEVTAAGVVGMLSFDDNLFDGGGTTAAPFTLTKNGAGILRFDNGRIQNLTNIDVQLGELRFEGGPNGGILGTVGSTDNKALSGGVLLAAAGNETSYNNFFTGTNLISVGNVSGSSAPFATDPRLSFIEARGTHNVNLNLSGSYLFVQSSATPLQPTSFAGTITLTGAASANGLEAIYTTSVNPVVMFGPLKGSGGLTKFGNNEVDFVNGASDFSGELVIARGTGNVATPSVGLFDGGRFTGVSSIRLTNDGTLFLDNRNSLDSSSANDNNSDRIHDTALISLGGSGRIRLIGNSSAPVLEAVGALSVHRGSTAIEFDPSSTSPQNIGMSFTSFQRDAGSVLNIRVLKTGVDFGVGAGSGANATITLATVPTMLGGDGSHDGQDLPIVPGVFGGVATSNLSTLAANNSIGRGLNINDEMFVGRGLMTVQSVVPQGGGPAVNYLRPLALSEYFNATIPDFQSDRAGNPILDANLNPVPSIKNRVTSTYDFGVDYTKGYEDPANPGTYLTPGNGLLKNVRLVGGFGTFTSSTAETLFSSEGFYIFDQADDSRKQDSLYRILTDISFNSLTFAQQTREIVDQGGNRIIVEIDPGKTLTIASGVILAGGLGIIDATDPNVAHTSTQQSLIRGGTLEFGNTEAIIQNVAASLNETTGLITNTRLVTPGTSLGNNNLTLSDLTISASVHGTKGLTKSGTGGVNLSGVNTYTGPTTVTEGILRLENDSALGKSTLVLVSGTGELRLQRGVSIGDSLHPTALTLRFGALSQTSQLRSETGNNAFFGNIEISAVSTAGDRFVTAANPYDVSIVNGSASAFQIGGDISGLDANSTGATFQALNDDFASPLNDVQRGRQARIVNFQNASALGGTIKLRGTFHDLQGSAVTSLVTSANEEQVLRSAFTGFNNSNFFLYSNWDSAGSILLRQGATRIMAGVTDFFTRNAANGINPSNAQARPTIGDVAGTTGATEVSLTLTTAGQNFNSPTLLVSNLNPGGNVTIGGENTTGTTKFFTPGTDGFQTGAQMQFNDASLRVSIWDRNVRLMAATGGRVEIYGKITDSNTAGGGLGGINKIGGGTVVLQGMDGNTANYAVGVSNNNDFDNKIAVSAGRLILNASVAGPSGSAIDTGTVNVWGSTGLGLVLNGGKLEIDTDSTASATQVWRGGVTIKPGASEIAVMAPSGATGAYILSLTNDTATVRSAGSTVNFVSNGSLAKINFLSTTANVVGGSGAILAPWATFGAAPGVVTDFAITTNDSPTPFRTVSPYASYAFALQDNPSNFSAGQIGSEGTNPLGTNLLASGIKMLRFGAPTSPTTINLASGFVLGNGAATATDEGTFLVPSATTARKTITGGDLQVAAFKDLYLFNYGTGGLTVASPIIGQSTSIVISGPGTTTLGLNRQGGSVYINDGVVELSKLNYEVTTFANRGTFGGSPTMFDLGDVTGIRTGSTVTGTNIPAGTTILSISGTVITLSGTGATAATGNNLTITPPATTTASVAFTSFGTNTATVAANAQFLAIGEAVVGAGIPTGTTITSINGTTIGLSNTPTSNGPFSFVVPNGLGAAPTAGLFINGGTLRYTGNSVVTDRATTIGDGGATFEVTQAGTTLNLPTLTAASVAYTYANGPTSNPYAGGLTKTGPGTLVISTTGSTYSGLTEVLAGTLTLLPVTTPLGTSTNILDGTRVAPNATLRLQPTASNVSADLALSEWFTFDANSTLDLNYPTAGKTVFYDGVSNFRGRTSITYSGAFGGSATYSFNPNAGYILGSGTIVKGTINNGIGGTMILNESNPEFRGGIEIQGGSLIIRSLGNPTGVGTGAANAIQVGLSGVNDLTPTTGIGSATAKMLFQMRDLVDVNGATSLTGAFDSFQINSNIPQDIVVNRPSNATPGMPSTQLKQIGVVGTGLSLDQYNLNGNLTLKDDLQFYVESDFRNVNAGEEFVTFNVNGHLISSGSYAATFTSSLNITNRLVNTQAGQYNNLYLIVNLANDNSGVDPTNGVTAYTGSVVIGNGGGVDAMGLPISNPDANQILRLSNDKALTAANSVTLRNDVTLQVVGSTNHNVTIGSLIDSNSADTQTTFTGGTTTGFITQGARAIVENGSAAASTLTLNQTVDSKLRLLIRDGVTPAGVTQGSLRIVKQGPATVTLVNSNYYSGGTLVTDGTLLVTNSTQGSATGSGDVRVVGATFGGTNAFPIAGSLTISDNGTQPGVLTPGLVLDNGIKTGGILNLSGLTFDHTGPNGYDRVEFDIYDAAGSTDNDQIQATTLTLNAPVDLVLRINYDPAGFGHPFAPGPNGTLGDRVQLFVLNSSSLTTGPLGTFTYQGNPVGNGSDLRGYYLDAAGGQTLPYTFRLLVNNNEVTLAAVPEPNVALTLASGVGMLLGLQRFRRRGSRS